jgi:heterodisulfide reductase subunit B
MKYAVHAVRDGEQEKLSRLIEMPVQGSVEIVSILEAYSKPDAVDAIKAAIKKPLTGLTAACYYGCLYTRPPKITGMDNRKDPMVMEEIMSLAGVTCVDWAFKSECCGASHHVDLPTECKPLLYRVLKNARASGAQALITACPMCMMNLDMRQGAVNMAFGEDFDMPVYFLTELLAVAMGASFGECGINTHFHPAKKLLKNLDKKKEVV